MDKASRVVEFYKDTIFETYKDHVALGASMLYAYEEAVAIGAASLRDFIVIHGTCGCYSQRNYESFPYVVITNSDVNIDHLYDTVIGLIMREKDRFTNMKIICLYALVQEEIYKTAIHAIHSLIVDADDVNVYKKFWEFCGIEFQHMYCGKYCNDAAKCGSSNIYKFLQYYREEIYKNSVRSIVQHLEIISGLVTDRFDSKYANFMRECNLIVTVPPPIFNDLI